MPLNLFRGDEEDYASFWYDSVCVDFLPPTFGQKNEAIFNRDRSKVNFVCRAVRNVEVIGQL